MDEIVLEWEGPFTGSELREKIIGVHPDHLFKDPKYGCLTWPGIYVFYRGKKIFYVGQGNKNFGHALRTRLKQHINNETVFSERLRKNGVEMDELSVIVAPFSRDYEDRLGMFYQIERAVMCPCTPPGHFKEPLKIINLGSIGPLPKTIEINF